MILKPKTLKSTPDINPLEMELQTQMTSREMKKKSLSQQQQKLRTQLQWQRTVRTMKLPNRRPVAVSEVREEEFQCGSRPEPQIELSAFLFF